MSNKTEFSTALKSKLLDGIRKINNSVSSTLGPSGRNVLIDDGSSQIKITKDGVTVASSFKKLEDKIENSGAQLLKQVALQSSEKVGDGTTTSTLLATVMVEEGIKAIQRGVNAVQVKLGIDTAVKAVIKRLQEISKDISSEEQILQVASISANNDEELGKLIALAMNKVGHDGMTMIEESNGVETSVDIVEGMQLDRGYSSPFFVTNRELMTAVLNEPRIFIYDGRIEKTKQLFNLLELAATAGKSLLIVSHEVSGDAAATLVLNNVRGNIKVAAVNAPEFGDKKTLILQDLAVVTGGTMLSEKLGHKLEKLEKSFFSTDGILGTANKVTITKDETIIVEGKGSQEEIIKRGEELKFQIDNSDSNYERERLQDRLSKLLGRVAVINVGAVTEVELKEKKDRLDDSLHATKAALAEGVVPGGGMALINCESAISELDMVNKDQELGRDIVMKALRAPFKKILDNAGIEDQYSILSIINEAKSRHSIKADKSLVLWEGYNVKSGEQENFYESGILDPTKVTRIALENAASVAGIILTTESIVYYEEDNKKDSVPGNSQSYEF